MLELSTVLDQPSPCPYLEQQTARMPLEIPAQAVSGADLDQLLAAGYRRSGWFYYRTACPACQACEPLRVDVPRFRESRSLRRVLQRGDSELSIRLGQPVCDQQRLRLFNLHREQRQLARDESQTDADEYASFLVASWNPTTEISYWLGEQLVAVAIMDVGQTSLSAVYCYFDPAHSRLSLGTYSILTQIRIARQQQLRWLYLGMYVAANRHLRYKARYLPHERWQTGLWRRYEIETEQA